MSRNLQSRFSSLLIVFIVLAGFHAFLIARYEIKVMEYAPFWSDEFMYYHQAGTVVTAGFNGGYYNINEQPAPWLRFYAWGAMLPLTYGAIGKLIGYEMWSIPFINYLLFGSALTAYIWFTHLKPRDALVLGGMMVVFYVQGLFAYTSYVELLQHAIATLLALGFYHLIKREDRVPWSWRVAMILAVGLATLYRMTWAVLFVPLFLVMFRPTKWWGYLSLLVGACAVALVFIFLVEQISSPDPNKIHTLVINFGISLQLGLQTIWDMVKINLVEVFHAEDVVGALKVSTHIQVLLLMALSGFYAMWIPLQRGFKTREWVLDREWLVHLLNISTPFIIMFLIYDLFGERSYRNLSVPLWLSLLLFVSFRRWLPLAIIAVANVAVTPAADGYFSNISGLHYQVGVVEQAEQARLEMEAYMPYRSDETDPWCNTVAFPTSFFDKHNITLYSIPFGHGLTTLWGLTPNLKSRYVLVDEVAKTFYQADENWIKLRDVEGGELYLNPATSCAFAPDVASLAQSPQSQ